jgi:site-specific recombinase XerD
MEENKAGAPAFTVGTAGLDALFEDYRITIMAEGKSPKTLEAARTALTQFQHFLYHVGSPEDVTVLTRNHIKAFSLYLKMKPCFTSHPYTPAQGRRLSGHTLNCYLRALRVFLGWCQEEGYIEENPFWGFSIPHPPRKVVPALPEVRVKALINAIDQSTLTGFRNYVMILTLLDTGLRSSELLNLDRPDVDMDQGMLRVLGKGNRERMVPIGRQVQQLLVDYIRDYRPIPAKLARKRLFLTEEGQPMDGGSLNRIMRRLKQKAGINGKCSPHVLRHTAAISFVRNGGDLFSLQKLLGHATLNMTRQYCEMAYSDVKRIHLAASPVDNLDLGNDVKDREG